MSVPFVSCRNRHLGHFQRLHLQQNMPTWIRDCGQRSHRAACAVQSTTAFFPVVLLYEPLQGINVASRRTLQAVHIGGAMRARVRQLKRFSPQTVLTAPPCCLASYAVVHFVVAPMHQLD